MTATNLADLSPVQMARQISTLAGGTIFSVDFIKRTDHKLRHMVCRLGVRKGQKGTGSAYDHLTKGLLCVYDVQKRDYRSIPLENVKTIKIRGKEFKVAKQNLKGSWYHAVSNEGEHLYVRKAHVVGKCHILAPPTEADPSARKSTVDVDVCRDKLVRGNRVKEDMQDMLSSAWEVATPWNV